MLDYLYFVLIKRVYTNYTFSQTRADFYSIFLFKTFLQFITMRFYENFHELPNFGNITKPLSSELTIRDDLLPLLLKVPMTQKKLVRFSI